MEIIIKVKPYNKKIGQILKNFNDNMIMLKNKEIKTLDFMIIKKHFDKSAKNKNFYFRDGYYWNNYKGYSSITINLNSIYNPLFTMPFKIPNNIIMKIFTRLVMLFIIILSSPVIIQQCVDDKNINFMYLYNYYKIPKIVKHFDKIDKIELKLVNRMLFFLGIHKYYPLYGKNNKYYNINIYEKASRYRNKLIYKYKWLFVQSDQSF